MADTGTPAGVWVERYGCVAVHLSTITCMDDIVIGWWYPTWSSLLPYHGIFTSDGVQMHSAHLALHRVGAYDWEHFDLQDVSICMAL
jgi:hypothetical protein